MNKSDLIETVASELECTRAEAQRAVDAVLSGVAAGLRTSGKVQLAGFGTFQKKTRAARQGKKPGTNEVIQIAESTTAGFKPASALKDSLS